jgi:hypothetical protein
MYRSDNFKQKETMGHAFANSCLGRIVIFLCIIVVLLIIAIFTKPSKKVMAAEATDGVLECIENNDSIKGDKIDDYITNLAHIFTTADTTQINSELLDGLKKYNRMEIHDHMFYRTAYLHNNVHPEGVRIAFGAYGLVLPTVTYDDLLLYIGKMHGEFNKAILRNSVNEQDMGTSNPVKEFHYKGDPED